MQDVNSENGEYAAAGTSRKGWLAVAWMAAIAVTFAMAWIAFRLFMDGEVQLGIIVLLVLTIISIPLVFHRLEAMRWLAPSLIILTVLVAYPAVYVAYLAFTNYSSSNSVSLERSIQLISTAPGYQVQTPGTSSLRYSAYRQDNGSELLLLLSGGGRAYVLWPEGSLVTIGEAVRDGKLVIDETGGRPIAPADVAAAVKEAASRGDALAERVRVMSLQQASVAATDWSGTLIFDADTETLYEANGADPSAWPATSAVFFQNSDGSLTIWAMGGSRAYVFAGNDEKSRASVPKQIGDYKKLPLGIAMSGAIITQLGSISFEEAGHTYRLNASDPTVFGSYAFQYRWDKQDKVFRDVLSGAVYRASAGNFRLDPDTVEQPAEDLRPILTPGYVSDVGFRNFEKLLQPDQVKIIGGLLVWSVLFAGLSVAAGYLLGLAAAILLNDPLTPASGTVRTLLILPYVMPLFLTVTMWRFFMDPQFGPVNGFLEFIGLPFQPNWTGQEFFARVALVLIMTWIFFPYFMLVAGGALKTIDETQYEAARIDGANGWQQFRFITFPMVTRVVGPILVATFAFFFTNVTVIQLFLRGGPTTTSTGPAYGSTDILASFAYRQAFPATGSSDFAYAAAVAVVIFVFLLSLSWVQHRLTEGQAAS